MVLWWLDGFLLNDRPRKEKSACHKMNYAASYVCDLLTPSGAPILRTPVPRMPISKCEFNAHPVLA